MIRDRVYVPEVDQIRVEIIEDAHYAAYALHPCNTKMYRNFHETS